MNASKPLVVGRSYTRRDIHAALGGNTVSCLPTNKGVIVAACLSKKFSPQAPHVILCGKGARSNPVSELLTRQRTAVPVFVKTAANCWQYHGQFLVKHHLTDGPELEVLLAGSGRAAATVSYAVVLEPVECQSA